MARSMILSNGRLSVALDECGMVRDLYYPYVGYEDHVRGHYRHRVGVFAGGVLSWVGDAGWYVTVSSREDALASDIVARHAGLGVELRFADIVYNERDIFLRAIRVTNTKSEPRDIKVYIAHQYEISKTHGGETAYYDPVLHCVVHYKGRRVFLMNAMLEGQPFDDYAVGLLDAQGQNGTFRDAEDGALSQNAIEHGIVDSVIGLYAPFSYAAGQTRDIYHWICAAQTIAEAHALNDYCLAKTPQHLVRTASDYWHAWVHAFDAHAPGLSDEHLALFRRSLMLMRAHVDAEGGVIASLDSDMMQSGNDTYSYVWPRDGAYVAMALDRAGDSVVSRRFFEFCNAVMPPEGYLMHKYLPDRALGSSWHPWIRNGKFQLPIQEDETGMVIIALCEHYHRTRDLEFLEQVFNTLVEAAANFMTEYRDPATRLPQPTYDLWEEKRGVSTYTSSVVYGALMAAAELAGILGKQGHESRYKAAAEEIREGIVKHLWSEREGIFLRMIHMGDAGDGEDRAIDISSVYGVFAFGVLSPEDPRVRRAFETSVRALSEQVTTGGIGRYVGDPYYNSGHTVPGNPWFITTLWYAEYLTALAKNERDLDRVKDIFTWVARHALPSGVLAEQIHPHTGAALSAAPLAWSHAGYVLAVLKYNEALERITPGVQKDTHPPAL